MLPHSTDDSTGDCMARFHDTNPVARAARTKEYNSAEYKAAKRAGQQLVDAGLAYCWRCGAHLPPGCAWHLGHDDWDRTIIRGPECPPCNLGAAARKGNSIAKANRTERGPLPDRTCSTCRSRFKPRRANQRTCSDSCHDALQQLLSERFQPVRIRPVRSAGQGTLATCSICGGLHATNRQYCSDACMWEANARKARDRYRAKAGLPVDQTEPTRPSRRWTL